MRRLFCTYRSFLLAVAGFALVLAAACKESYAPPVVSTDKTYLVVEGFINNGPDTTRISLTHTFKLDDTAYVVPETGAVVTVQGKNGGIWPLTGIGGGVYAAPGLSLARSQPYRLDIRTSGGKEYASDYVELKESPPIDSIGWTNSGRGLQIYANTHDPQDGSRYYRWDYTETWQFHSFYYSLFRYMPSDSTIHARTPNTIYTCWKTDQSDNVLTGSSAKLAKDEIYQAPLVLIPPDNWKVSVKYSILVRQYVITPEAYDFWQQLLKNSEQIGSVFSPQPSEAKGNIHNLADSTELVIGFISAGTMVQKRVFITPGQIPGWQLGSYTTACAEVSIAEDSLPYFLGGGFSEPVDFAPSMRGIHYYIAPTICVNCTLTGSNSKPSFWPD